MFTFDRADVACYVFLVFPLQNRTGPSDLPGPLPITRIEITRIAIAIKPHKQDVFCVFMLLE